MNQLKVTIYESTMEFTVAISILISHIEKAMLEIFKLWNLVTIIIIAKPVDLF